MILAATWKHASMKSAEVPPVYNCSFDEKMSITLEQIYQLGTSAIFAEIPLGQEATPSMVSTKCGFFYGIMMFFLQLLPAMLRDSLLNLTGKESKSMQHQRELHESIKSYRKFIHRKLVIKNEKAYELTLQLRNEDFAAFDYENDHLMDFTSIMRNAMFSLRRLIFNLEDENIELDRKKFDEVKQNEIWIETVVGCAMLLMLYSVAASFFECCGKVKIE